MNKILRKEVVVFDTFVDYWIDSPTMLERLKRNV